MTHICVSKLAIISSDNGLSPGRRQAIIWTNAGILLIGSLGTNFSEILIAIQISSFGTMHLKMSSAKWRPFCFGLNVLTMQLQTPRVHIIIWYMLVRWPPHTKILIYPQTSRTYIERSGDIMGYIFSFLGHMYHYAIMHQAVTHVDHYGHGLGPWEKALLCNVSSHWLAHTQNDPWTKMSMGDVPLLASRPLPCICVFFPLSSH